jgi:hypothetical protein
VEPAKPFEKKSELTKKMNVQPGGGPAKLPPLVAAPKGPDKIGGGGGLNETKNGAAYQVERVCDGSSDVTSSYLLFSVVKKDFYL